MMKIEELKDRIEPYEFLSIQKKKIEDLLRKVHSKELYVVVIGEFSAGKTSLINTLFNVNLPVNVLPETSSIWQIRLTTNPNTDSKVKVCFRSGNIEIKENIEEVKEIDSKEIAHIEIELYSPKIDNIIVVDTPGLSSLDPDPKKVLDNFIEKADVILVAVDVNQGGITKTTKKFVEDNSYGQKTYVVLTKVDTKSPSAVSKIKKQIEKDFGDKIERVLVSSSMNSQNEEIKDLLNEIYRNKQEIITSNVNLQMKLICSQCLTILREQIKNTYLNTEELDEKWQQYKRQIRKVEIEIKKRRKEMEEEIDRAINRAVRKFRSILLAKKAWIVNALYDQNLSEGINDRMDRVINDAIHEAIADIEQYLRKYFDNFKIIPPNVDSEGINGLTVIFADLVVRFRENAAAKILTLIEFGPLQVVAQEVFTKAIEWGTKSFVQKNLEEKIDEITVNFQNELEKILKDEFNVLIQNFMKDLQSRKSELEKGIEEIKCMKQEKLEAFNKYVEGLKELEKEMEACSEEVGL